MRRTGTLLILAAFAGTGWAQTQVQSTTTYGGNLGMSSEMRDTSGMNQGASSSRDGRGMVTSGGGIALQSDTAPVNASVPAVSGGVSLNARDNMRANEPRHNVKMVFALNTGNYVSDVQVQVKDGSGKIVLNDVSNGPWLYAQLPAGTYTATATYNGRPVTQRFSVGRSGVRTAQFRWPASVENAVGASAAAEAGGQILGTGPEEPQGGR